MNPIIFVCFVIFVEHLLHFDVISVYIYLVPFLLSISTCFLFYCVIV